MRPARAVNLPELSMRGTLCWPPSLPRDRIQSSKPPGSALTRAGQRQAASLGAEPLVMGVAAGELVVEPARKAARSAGVRGTRRRRDDSPAARGRPGPTCQSRTDAPGPRRGDGDRPLDLLADHVLAEGRERVPGPAGEGQAGGASDSNRTVSPMTCAHIPAQVETTIA